jgi:protein-tyrosine phosphatase
MASYSFIYKIPLPVPRGGLSIISRPRGHDWLEDDLRALRTDGITHVVSLLELDEANDLGLGDEAVVAVQEGLKYTNIPVPDRSVPTDQRDFLSHASRLAESRAKGDSIGIHCRQSIGRSSLLAVTILLLAGQSLDAALEQVQLARGLPIPETPEQLAWLKHMLWRIDRIG